MQINNDDIANLTKKLPANMGSYHECALEHDVTAAVNRWPFISHQQESNEPPAPRLSEIQVATFRNLQLSPIIESTPSDKQEVSTENCLQAYLNRLQSPPAPVQPDIQLSTQNHSPTESPAQQGDKSSPLRDLFARLENVTQSSAQKMKISFLSKGKKK